MTTQTVPPVTAREVQAADSVADPFRERLAANRLAMFGAVGPKQIAGIMQALIAQGNAGKVAAFRLVLDYTVGKPSKSDVETPRPPEPASPSVVDKPSAPKASPKADPPRIVNQRPKHGDRLDKSVELPFTPFVDGHAERTAAMSAVS